MRIYLGSFERKIIGLMAFFFIAAMVVPSPRHEHTDDHSHENEESRDSFPGLYNEKPFFSHIHGIAFTSAYNLPVIAAHDGLWFYEGTEWSNRNLPAHDFMGFASTNDGFYASGHPDLTTDYPNPLGLVKVSGDGKPMKEVSFAGEIDFHILAAGYLSGAIYLYNEEDNANLSIGLHYTFDEGEKWNATSNYPAQKPPLQMAVHPTDIGTMAFIASNDLYLTRDKAKTFESINRGDVTTLYFHPDGARLVFGKASLIAYDLMKRTSDSYPSPITEEDAFTHIAIDDKSESQIMLATESRAIYVSDDRGKTWSSIASGSAKESGTVEPCDCGSD